MHHPFQVLKRLTYALVVSALVLSSFAFQLLNRIYNPKHMTCAVSTEVSTSSSSKSKYTDSLSILRAQQRLGFRFDPSNGEKLFKANCNTCHMMGRNMTGPDLQGVIDRWPDIDTLQLWIMNPNIVIQSGYPYAVNLFKEWNMVLMPPQPVNKQDVKDILGYIEVLR